MQDYSYYLQSVGEIGFVEQSVGSLLYVSGLPTAHPREIVMFENGEIGQILALTKESAQVLLLGHSRAQVGSKVVRTGKYLEVPVSNDLLGKTIDPLGNIRSQTAATPNKKSQEVTYKNIEMRPPSISSRKVIESQLETGVAIVDLVIPLGKGQRELVIGDRKTGKSEFLLQTILTQAQRGTVCIYAMIGQKQMDILKLDDYFTKKGIRNNSIIVASSSSEPAGLIFLTPYTAMTIAEYFRDQGLDVLLILDDMTTHARTYREISLLAKRFPGRGSYPGDIFNIHAKLIERAGNFTKGSITCLPVAESVLGDLSGYIQTNLMSMTDGHIFFDIELYNQGKRPAVNPFLSVTRVGHQTQSVLQRDLSGVVSNFLVAYEKMKQFMHFGAEVGESSRSTLALGQRVDAFLNQGTEITLSVDLNMFILALVWSGVWNDVDIPTMNAQTLKIIELYSRDQEYKKKIAQIISSSNQFMDLITAIKRDQNLYSIIQS